ncbi:hypothetical protein ACKC9G_13845 [Pokkaliibacter sp. CJK22405]|uniref:hypothetical protein n=1 Tax=Pokkaliibacter sp. CJK22405 TaxID=3384615 RepID=UPI0039855850
MKKLSKQATPNEPLALIAPHTLWFVASIMGSIVAIAMVMTLLAGVLSQFYDFRMFAKGLFFGLIPYILLLIHPNIMMTRGKMWPMTWMRLLVYTNVMLLLVLSLFAFRQSPALLWAALVGITASLFSGWFYHSKAAVEMIRHYQAARQSRKEMLEEIKTAR